LAFIWLKSSVIKRNVGTAAAVGVGVQPNPSAARARTGARTEGGPGFARRRRHRPARPREAFSDEVRVVVGGRDAAKNSLTPGAITPHVQFEIDLATK
jgi:hypothetical protein